MIEAQEAATEGTHVAVPEGLVPAMTTGTVTAELSYNPPGQDTALSTFTLESSEHSYDPYRYYPVCIYAEIEA